MGIFNRIRQILLRLPIIYRIAIGNSAVIVLGAIGGTLITRNLVPQADGWLIIFFASVGIILSVTVNFIIIKSALRPLRELSQLVQRVQTGQSSIDPRFLGDTDPEISQLAAALNSLVKLLEDRNLQLRALSERAINAQEDERRQIALTLHDDTGQSLLMLIINLERMQVQIPSDAAELHARLSAALDLAKEALADLRKVVYGLRPTILDDLGLVPAIRWYARTNLEEAGIRVEIQTEAEVEPLPPQVKSTLFRITQEAINNIVRHSKAKSARIQLYRYNGEIRLIVEDDGIGFDVDKVTDQAIQQQKLGLLGIQERAEMIGGKVSLEAAPDHGTRLSVGVPLAEQGV